MTSVRTSAPDWLMSRSARPTDRLALASTETPIHLRCSQAAARISSRVLADARRKDHGVSPVRGGGHCCDLRPKTMKIDIHRKNGRRIPTRPMFQQLPHIAGQTTRERKQTAASLEGIGKRPGRNAMRCDPRDRSRIDIARARRHDESLGRRETHGGVNRETARSRGHRGTSTQMANHKSQRIDGTFQERRGTIRRPLATQPVEAIAAQLPVLDPRRRERVTRSGRFERGMERCVEAGDSRHIRREMTQRIDCGQCRRIVQRREIVIRRVGIESRHRSRRGG